MLTMLKEEVLACLVFSPPEAYTWWGHVYGESKYNLLRAKNQEI